MTFKREWKRENREKALALKSYDPVKVAAEAVQARGDASAKEHERVVVLPRRVEGKPAIERYFARGAIDVAHKAAADRLLADFMASGFNQRVVADYGQSVGGGGSDHGPPLGPKAA